ncbi:MAG: MarR family transcriptional regulator [Pseudomonadota bacterium]
MKSSPTAAAPPDGSSPLSGPSNGGGDPPATGSTQAPSGQAPPAAPFDLGAFLPYRLARLAEAVSAEFAEVYGDRYGLSRAEWRVLAHLSQADAVSVREIHAQVHLDKPSITRAAQRLAGAGYVRRTGSEADRRLVSLSLTREGRALMAELVPLARQAERRALAALPPAEADAFGRLVDALLAARRSP